MNATAKKIVRAALAAIEAHKQALDDLITNEIKKDEEAEVIESAADTLQEAADFLMSLLEPTQDHRSETKDSKI